MKGHVCRVHRANNNGALAVTIPAWFVKKLELKEGTVLHFEDAKVNGNGTKAMQVVVLEQAAEIPA